MMSNKQIKFTVGNVAEGYKTVEIVIRSKGAISYSILRSGLLNVDKKIVDNVEVSEEWLNELAELNIFEWKENYSSNELNGTQWELIFNVAQKSYRGHGSNAYPENWERFLDWLDTLIPEMEFVNRKRLEKVTMDYSRESAIGYTLHEKLTLNRREKTLMLDKLNSSHCYRLGKDIIKIFDAAQKFLDALEVGEFNANYPAQIKIELIRHDGSIENFDAIYTELCLPGLSSFVNELKSFITDLTAEVFTPVTEEIESAQGKYILCKVRFDGSYKHYTYQTEDETLAVGDIVDVPVGKNNDTNQARIVEIGYFDEYELPIPLERIKTIIGKHVVNSWENY